MLNEYHLQFLKHLSAVGARFLIVGGQARYQLFGTPTRDLDIWLDWEGENRRAAETALVRWSERYPAHTFMPLVAPLPFQPGKQVKFPDDDVLYQSDNGELVDLSVTDGIDVLTSIANWDFEWCFKHSFQRQIGDLNLHFLGESDLLASAKC